MRLGCGDAGDDTFRQPKIEPYWDALRPVIEAAEAAAFILRHRTAEAAEPKTRLPARLARITEIEKIEGQRSGSKLGEISFLRQLGAIDRFRQRL